MIPRFKTTSFLFGCLVTVLFCLFYYSFKGNPPPLVETVDNHIMDLMFRFRGKVAPSDKILIVDIDERSLGQVGQWPWPRDVLARLTQILTAQGVRAMGFDIVFPEPDRSSPSWFVANLPKEIKDRIPETLRQDLSTGPAYDHDGIFGQTLSKGPTVLGYYFQLIDDGLKSLEAVPFPSCEIRLDPGHLNYADLGLIRAYRAVINHPGLAMAQSEGFYNVATDESGTARQVPLIIMMDGVPYPSLSLEVFRLGLQIPGITVLASEQFDFPQKPVLGIRLGASFIHTNSRGEIYVNYRGPRETFTYVSALDVLAEKDLGRFKDALVIVGSSAAGLFDLRATPFGASVPGIEINATIIDNLLNNDPIRYDRYTEIAINFGLVLLGGLLLSLVLSATGPVTGLLITITAIVGSFLVNYQYFFLNLQKVGLIYPVFTWLGLLLMINVLESFREGKSKRFIQTAFSHYVSPEVVDALVKNPKGLSLAGEEKDLTIMFCDIRGFAGISESMAPRELGQFMNQFLTRMSRIILNHNGTVDKFIGDAIMAFWGAPKEEPDHGIRAVEAALDMKREIHRMNQERQHQNLPLIHIGIGINSGCATVGNFGSRERFDYTAMGDNVNLASRLEGANKNYGTTILVSENTWAQVKDAFYFRFIDRVQVKGRTQPVNIYEPISKERPAAEVQAEVQLFEEGVAAYQKREFAKACDIFARLVALNPCQLYGSYLERVNSCLESPPPDTWEGAERRRRLPVFRLDK